MSPNHGAPGVVSVLVSVGSVPQPLWRELFGDRGTIAIVWVFASHQGGAAIAASGAVVRRRPVLGGLISEYERAA
jgi:hypothetical protein